MCVFFYFFILIELNYSVQIFRVRCDTVKSYPNVSFGGGGVEDMSVFRFFLHAALHVPRSIIFIVFSLLVL